MLYKVTDTLEEIRPEDVSDDCLTVGIVSCEELKNIGPLLGFDSDTIDASQHANPRFRTGADVRETYTFAELRLIDTSENDDYASIFLKKNLLLVVDILDRDQSTQNSFMNSLKRRAGGENSLEVILCYFVDDLLKDGNKLAETLQNDLSRLEESIVNGRVSDNLNQHLLSIKKRIRKYSNFYAQMQDVFQTLQDNINDIFDDSRLMHISNSINKINRSRDEINSLASFADYIQGAYSSLMDQKLNNTMKRITVITTVFFPLTIIVGWYGMNFKYMPELNWRYGYLCVFILSAIVILILLLIGKKRKWF